MGVSEGEVCYGGPLGFCLTAGGPAGSNTKMPHRATEGAQQVEELGATVQDQPDGTGDSLCIRRGKRLGGGRAAPNK